MSDDKQNGSGKEDKRPELTPAEMVAVAALIVLLLKVFGGK